MASAEQRVKELGLTIPDYADPPYGLRYAPMKPFHRSGHILTLSGMTPEDRQGNKVFPGRVGENVTQEQAYQAARYAAINTLGMIRLAVGSLDDVRGFVSTLCVVATVPEFVDVNLVTNGAADLYVDVFGHDIGRAPSMGLGIVSLSGGNVFELTAILETHSVPEGE